MAELDLYAIKERIVDILDSNTSLYDSTGASGKVRKIQAGIKFFDFVNKETTLPVIYVTNDLATDIVRVSGSVSSNTQKVLNHDLRFKIFLIVDGKDGQKAEEKADDLIKLIKESINANYDLRDPTAGTDPKVQSAYIERDERRTPDFGANKQVRQLVLRCSAMTS